MTHHVVQYSGGAGSWATARVVLEDIAGPGDEIVLLFADTLIEDHDLYRFLKESSENLGLPITRTADGRTPWEVFNDKSYIGNTRIDPCSYYLKRVPLRRWLEELPEVYAEHEAEENAFRAKHQKDVSILRDRRGGRVRSLPLEVLRRRVETGDPDIDADDVGGCGCAVGDLEQDAEVREAMGEE